MQQLTCYLSLGANLGDRAEQLAEALKALKAHPRLALAAVSDAYETAAVADEPQPDYLNLVVALQTDLTPLQLLHVCQEIEQRLGRTRPYHHAPRTIDIDLLACGDIIAHTPELTLPHPRMLERQFVLVPLADVAPELSVAGSKPVGKLANRADPEVRRVGRLDSIQL
ncbi:MAG: 2-amino-4-hydroxy-6-hydroxymethyldihydropteridine diphosphokinase [Armatimonadia bacterium]